MDECWVHHVVERRGELQCGECCHWFADVDELVGDFEEMCRRNGLDPPASVKDIWFCPHCSHDF